MASAGAISPASGSVLVAGTSVTFSCTASFTYPERCSSVFYIITADDSSGSRVFYETNTEEYSDFHETVTFSHSVAIPATATSVSVEVTFSFSTLVGYSSVESSASYTSKAPIPTVAPSNFVAVQNGKHVRFTWTAGSGDGTMSYLVTIGGDTKISGCEEVTGTESTWTDCHDYYNKSVQFKLVYYLNGSPKGSIAYQLNIGTPSASAAIGVTQASKAKQVTVSWSGSYSYVSPTSITFTVTCSGSSGNLYSGGSAGSVAYTPPQYGTSYTYVVNYVVKNTYGDTFTATASKAFSAAAPYHTVGIYDHGQWKQCIVHIYQSGWKECYVHVFQNNHWKLCDGS